MGSGKLVKNYIYNTIYQVLIMIAPIVTMPYISRVLGVTNIGIYQYTESIAAYFVLAGSLGTSLYGQREIAYLQDRPQERSRAFREIEICRVISVSICLVFYILVFCIRGPYVQVYRILTVYILATAFDISWLFMGMEDFRLTVLRNTVIKVLGVICVFLFVKSADDLNVYAVCMTFPILLGNLSLWISLRKYISKVYMPFRELVAGIRNRIRPILIMFVPQIAINVYTVLDKTMIGLLARDMDQVGYYSQAQRVVNMVLTIVTSLGIVMLPAMSAAFARKDLQGISDKIRTAFQFTYMLAFPLLFGMCVIAPRFVPIFFGSGYDPVIPLMIVLSPILVIIGTSNVIGQQYLLPTGQQRAYTASILAGAGTNFLLNLLIIPVIGAFGAAVATVIAEIAVTGVQCWYIRGQLPFKKCLLSGVRYVVLGAIMYLVCRQIGRMLPPDGVWPVAIMIAIGAVVYVLELILSRDPMLKLAAGYIRNR